MSELGLAEERNAKSQSVPESSLDRARANTSKEVDTSKHSKTSDTRGQTANDSARKGRSSAKNVGASSDNLGPPGSGSRDRPSLVSGQVSHQVRDSPGKVHIPPAREATPAIARPSEPTSSPCFRFASSFPTSPAAPEGERMMRDVDSAGGSTGSKSAKRKTGQENDDGSGPSRKKSKSKGGEVLPRRKSKAGRRSAQQDPASKDVVTRSRRVEQAVPEGENKDSAGDGTVMSESEDVGAIIPVVPQGAPKYVENALALCAWVGGDKRWETVVKAWLLFDQAAEFKPRSKELSRLPTGGRPKEVGTWVSHARSATFRPEVDLPRFANEFAVWWRRMQPEGREELEDEFIALTKPSAIEWSELSMSGPNGIVNIVGALAWWYKAVHALPQAKLSKTGRSGQKRDLELARLTEALDEVSYVFGKLTV